MYFDFYNQLANLARFSFAFTLVFIICPWILFEKREEIGLDGLVARYVQMVCLTIPIGYLLVLTKLYELISLITLFIIWVVYKYRINTASVNSPEQGISLMLSLYDLLEGKLNLVVNLRELLFRTFQVVKNILKDKLSSFTFAGNTLLLVGVLLYSAYIRFYDAIKHAAPAMSDAYVTLAWMKYIEKRELFHDGIYPQGFHIYLSVLHKFTFSDPLYILKYTGPLNSLLTIIGLYFVVSRLTGKRMPGILSALIYGVLVEYLHLEWARQVSTNAQEFAMIFLLPGWYFAHRYLTNYQKSDFWTALAAFFVIGWVHTIVFVFLIIGVFCLAVAHLTIRFKEALSSAFKLGLALATAGVLAVIPAILGILLGKTFHSSSVNFLTGKLNLPFQPISLMDQVTLGSIVVFFLVCLLTKKSKQDMVMPLFILLLGIGSYSLYATLGPLTGNAVMVSRMGLLWGIVAPVGLGFGWYALGSLVPGQSGKQIVELICGVAVILVIAATLRVDPVAPYKMEYDSTVEQYLRISENYRPTEWMIVSAEEGYALVLGNGYHLMMGDFLNWYNPTDQFLTRIVGGKRDMLVTPDIFIFSEKKIFRNNVISIEQEMEPIRQRRAREYQRLEEWQKAYIANHQNLSIYYEDPEIKVLHIHQPNVREKAFRDIWGIEREKSVEQPQ